jgi:hypothetical protein
MQGTWPIQAKRVHLIPSALIVKRGMAMNIHSGQKPIQCLVVFSRVRGRINEDVENLDYRLQYSTRSESNAIGERWEECMPCWFLRKINASSVANALNSPVVLPFLVYFVRTHSRVRLPRPVLLGLPMQLLKPQRSSYFRREDGNGHLQPNDGRGRRDVILVGLG